MKKSISPGKVLIDKYFLIPDQKGEKGGNGQVYFYEDKAGKQYAIKYLYNTDGKNKRSSRFCDEIDTLIKLNNKGQKGIIPIIDYDKKALWYSMPMATPIFKQIKESYKDEKSFVFIIISLFYKLSQTLASLHKDNIFHRDIKPANILFYNDEMCFCDFGLVDFPEHTHITPNDKPLGAIFTIAPEMKRNPNDADGLKADVYSMAKTLWMLLTLDDKGFEGQFNKSDKCHSLQQYPHLQSQYLVEIEELLEACTSNSPEERPTMECFCKKLQEWMESVCNPNLIAKKEWSILKEKLFKVNPEIVSWYDPQQIVHVLNTLSDSHVLNHILFPDGGGQDFQNASLAQEKGFICIKDHLDGYHLLCPKKLSFVNFPNEESWNYFFLETKKNQPILNQSSYCYEHLVEDYPGHYVSARYAQYGVYDYDTGDKFPKGYRLVSRYTTGIFLIVLKIGVYNHIPATYDGRHSFYNNCDDFRDYIYKMINSYPFIKREELLNKKTTIKQVEKKAELFDPLIDSEIESLVFDLKNVSNPRDIGFYFCLEHQITTIGDAQYYLGKNGKLLEKDILGELGASAYVISSRELALQINKELNQDLANKIHRKAGSYFYVYPLKFNKPKHFFTKEEIKVLLANADDREDNILVIDEGGYPSIVHSSIDAQTYPIRLETWDAGHCYVGKYSTLSYFDEMYKALLNNWIIYLGSDCTRCLYVDDYYIDSSINEDDMIKKIIELMTT